MAAGGDASPAPDPPLIHGFQLTDQSADGPADGTATRGLAAIAAFGTAGGAGIKRGAACCKPRATWAPQPQPQLRPQLRRPLPWLKRP